MRAWPAILVLFLLASEVSGGTSCDACFSSKSKQKLTSLSLRYTGSTNPSSNNQGSKADVNGPSSKSWPDIAQVVSSTGQTFNQVSKGIDFTIVSGFRAETTLTITGEGTVEIHTSCSVPLAVGDTFGPFTVTCFVNENGDTCSQVCISV